MTSVVASPLRLFRTVAVAEAVTWALLLLGMFLKYVTETTELGVRVFGLVHGVVFIGYCLTTLVVAVDQRWPAPRTVLGLAASVPPFCTVLFDVRAERRGVLGTTWRLRSDEPTGTAEGVAARIVRKPLQGALALVAAVAVLTVVALAVGPPGG